MNINYTKFRLFILFILILSFSRIDYSSVQGKKILSFNDIMKFKETRNISISDDGLWVAFEAVPDRGDGEVHIYSTDGKKKYTIKRGNKPLMSKNGKWTAMYLAPGKLDRINRKIKKLKPGMVFLNNLTGEKIVIENVGKFAFTPDSKFIAYLKIKKGRDNNNSKEKNQSKKKDKTQSKKEVNSNLKLIELNEKNETIFKNVSQFSIDNEKPIIIFIKNRKKKTQKALYMINLAKSGLEITETLISEGNGFSHLKWSKKGSILVFAKNPSKKNRFSSSSLFIYYSKKMKLKKILANENLSPRWVIPRDGKIIWTEDNKRLFIGFKPLSELRFYSQKDDKKEKITSEKYFSTESILKKSRVDIWHWNDPIINSQQKVVWKKNKKRDYLWVYHLKSGKLTPLADCEMKTIIFNKNPYYSIGLSAKPYLKQLTWNGSFQDIYSLNLKTGLKKIVAKKVKNAKPFLSPSGKYILYYSNSNWFLYNTFKNKTLNLTSTIKTPFFNEDNDYPQPPDSYGIGGWVGNDSAVIIYDKYDLWLFPTNGNAPKNITNGEGRRLKNIFRIIKTDKDKKKFKYGESVLLSVYSDINKDTRFARISLDSGKIRFLTLERGKTYSFIKKAKRADKIIITKEDIKEFPDLLILDTQISYIKKISDLNPQINNFLWGKSNLVRWKSIDGIPLDGIIITPENYMGKKRLPVLVYYYRFFSKRLYRFNQMKINHRPNFPFYASNGYAVFLPDIRFEIGRPGFSATKCLVPGVQKIIDMGIADPNAIALHGHSWSGYQTAFVITQTNIFTCAIAGAPVSNMTSAYSGIRWRSGMARQFQYEKSQSRLGVSLWENIIPYIENSPVFFADRIKTPLLIEFGDKDGAVPWYQGIELYLAMRRLGKQCIFLQYRGEPHHLQKYPNKLDYSIRFKQYLDHYLKKVKAPQWISDGVLYRQ